MVTPERRLLTEQAVSQDMLYGLICMSAPPGELWMKNQDADQKKRSSYVWLFQVGVLMRQTLLRTGAARCVQLPRCDMRVRQGQRACSCACVAAPVTGLPLPCRRRSSRSY